MPRDPAKAKANQARYYQRHKERLLGISKARYEANRQDRIDYQHHYRSVQKTLRNASIPPPLSVVCHGRG